MKILIPQVGRKLINGLVVFLQNLRTAYEMISQKLWTRLQQKWKRKAMEEVDNDEEVAKDIICFTQLEASNEDPAKASKFKKKRKLTKTER